MEEKTSPIRVFTLHRGNYSLFRDEMVDLYLNAFTTGEYAQFIARQTAESALDEMLRNGGGNMAFIQERLAGVLLAFPLAHDNDFPKSECPPIPVEQSVYIAEVMTHTDFRGRGVATQLIKNFLHTAKDGYTHAVIRVWDKNAPALSLYENWASGG